MLKLFYKLFPRKYRKLKNPTIPHFIFMRNASIILGISTSLYYPALREENIIDYYLERKVNS